MERQQIDREKTCPLLLRTFWSVEKSHGPSDYKDAALGSLPANEVQIYTWPDASLREITDLVKDVIVPSAARQRNNAFDISLVYPDRNGDHKMRHVSRIHLNRSNPDENRTLAELNFETGDYVDITVVSGGVGEREFGGGGRSGGRGGGGRRAGGRGGRGGRGQRF